MPHWKISGRNISLQTAIIPVYIVSKVCCLNAFTYVPLSQCIRGRAILKCDDCIETGLGNVSAKRYKEYDGKSLAFSLVGLVHALGCSLAYTSYHILSSLSQSGKLTDSNLVRVAIDLKNQYIGCILVLGLVTVSMLRQPSLNCLVQVLLSVDRQTKVMVQTAELSSGTHVTANNLVWLSDRIKLLNRWLLQLQPHLARGKEASFDSVRQLVRIHGKLLNAIGILNRCFGVQNTILLLYQFVTLVELGYNTCMMSVRYAEADIQQGDTTEDFLETLYWVVWFLVEIFVLCYFSHVTVDEIIGATTTYLIILIQFDQSFNEVAYLMNGINTGKPAGEASSQDYSRQQFLRCFRPLHILSSTFALWPFSVPTAGSTLFNRWSTPYVLVVVTAYSAFHLYINYTDAYGIATGEEGADPTRLTPTSGQQQQVEANFVSIVIDIYNRYSGLILFWLLHAVALATQRSLAAIVSGVLLIDEQIANRLSLVPNHAQWCRFICFHTAIIFLGIGFAEWYNCIMYMSDFIPASEYCIFECFITMLTSSTVEIQYVAFVQLIKNRLQLINDLLVELTSYGNDEVQVHYERVRLEKRIGGEVHPTMELLSEIASSNTRPHQQSRTDPIERTAKTNQNHSNEPSVPRGDQRWHKIKRQHKIITVNQAAPSVVSRSQNAQLPAQFPLLVASLLQADSHSKASAHHIRAKIINDIKNLYTHLHLLSLNINKAYGAQLIFILMTLFITLTTLLYYCTMKLFRMLWLGQWATPTELLPTFWEVLSTLSWAFISTFRILRICNVCNSTKNEAQKIGSHIHGLGWKTNCPDTKSMVRFSSPVYFRCNTPDVNQGPWTEVRILSLQLQQQRIEFTAGGLFTIDHGLMFNIVGSLATYLLILIQFDIAQNGPKWKTELPTGGMAPLV
uniref:Gustatory receptor n=1 Tax=Anopheles christyi TaxID=43041 RepID=A0A182JXF1_9DIPT